MKSFVRGVSWWALVSCVGAVAVAGNLTPPAGPVMPTMKPLPDVEPRTAINATNTPGDSDSLFRITQPGSYYLTGNVAGVNGKYGIEVVSGSNTTIDLNGFSMVGSSLSQSAVYIDAGGGNIVVRNGTMRGWSLGVETLIGTNMLFEGLTVSECRSVGIDAGTNSIVRRCVVRLCAEGIFVASGSIIDECMVRDSSFAGITAGTGCIIRGCEARDNGGIGIAGDLGAQIESCIAISNDADGIQAAEGSRIAGCIALSNVHDGIQVSADCMITENQCSTNGAGAGDGANIHALGNDNRIDGNHCVEADRGIDVDTGGNFIVRNSCSGNTMNYAITGTQTIGPIITATGTITSSNPWANFEF